MALSESKLELEQRVKHLEACLRQRLSPGDFRLVWQLRQLEELATVAACVAWEQRFLDALARHFPGHELAIRAVAEHVRWTNGDCDTLADCDRLRGLPSGRPGT